MVTIIFRVPVKPNEIKKKRTEINKKQRKETKRKREQMNENNQEIKTKSKEKYVFHSLPIHTKHFGYICVWKRLLIIRQKEQDLVRLWLISRPN